jgi:16S rRNA G966 N2-methylase RsmD
MLNRIGPSPQQFLNGEIHGWYKIVLGYSDHLVSQLLDRFGAEDKKDAGWRVLDPFCGTGTTLVESMKRGVSAVGIDANPSSLFAARVKTNWDLQGPVLLGLVETVRASKRYYLRRRVSYQHDPTYRYIASSGMLKRGWICPEPLRKAIAVKRCIVDLEVDPPYKNALLLALIAEVVQNASNVKFGPELYCGPPKGDVNVFDGFASRVQRMALDLELAHQLVGAVRAAQLIAGDAREVGPLLRQAAQGQFSAVICSPPYPTEHDYTRNSRLELAFLEQVTDIHSLRAVKRQMIRSHTKGIYRTDMDAEFVKGHAVISAIAEEIDARTAEKTDGFAKLYSRVLKEYFGGMKRHLQSVRGVLEPGAQCAYVVGEQSSYASVHIPTAQILSSLAEECGYEVVAIEHWRTRRSTTTSRAIGEHIVLLTNPVA